MVSMKPTRERILDTARALFNEHGAHRVGVRDIARALEISPGNLAYHFPTKDDLVAALVRELRDLNATDVFGELPDDFSLETLYRAALVAMGNMLQYRFLLLSYVDAVRASPELRRLESELWHHRRGRYEAMLAKLADNGYLDGRATRRQARYLYEQGDLISSGWLGAALIKGAYETDEAAMLHYAKVGCALLDPYCTPKGRRQMRKILSGERDACLG